MTYKPCSICCAAADTSHHHGLSGRFDLDVYPARDPEEHVRAALAQGSEYYISAALGVEGSAQLQPVTCATRAFAKCRVNESWHLEFRIPVSPYQRGHRLRQAPRLGDLVPGRGRGEGLRGSPGGAGLWEHGRVAGGPVWASASHH